LDGAEMNLAGPLQVGWGSGGGHGNGTVTQDGGLFTSTSGITIGNSAAVPGDPNLPGSTGLYTLNNGTIELVGPLIAGLAGTGHFVMNGGSLETAAYLQIGRTGTGSFVQSAGDVAINRTSVDPAIVIASHAGGVGVYEISGGSLTVADT